MGFMLCNIQHKIQSETTFNLKINNHQEDLSKKNSLQADKNFRLPGHSINNTQNLQ